MIVLTWVQIAEPAGIFALSSAPAPASASAVKLKLIEADAVPLEYTSRTVMVSLGCANHTNHTRARLWL
jgi:hypothetical protein